MAITAQLQDATGLKVSMVATITTVGGAVLRLCSSGAWFMTSGSMQYIPTILAVPEVVQGDDGGVIRAVLILAQAGPYYDNASATRYQRLSDFLRSYPIEGATITVQRRIWTSSSDDETDTLMTGRVTQVSNAGNSTVTLQCEQRDTYDIIEAPRLRIDPSGFSTDEERDEIPQESDGEVIPMAFGEALSYKPQLFSGLTDAQVQTILNYGSFPPRGFTALAVRQTDAEVRYLWAESSGLLAPVSTPGSTYIKAFMYMSQVGRYAYLWDGLGGVSFGTSVWNSKGWYMDVPRAPYMTLALPCTKVDEDLSVGLTSGKRAIDGRHETYATVGIQTGGNGYQGVWELPNFPQLGRIVRNTSHNPGFVDTNDHEPGKPAGIRLYAIIANTGGAAFTGGSVYLDMVYPSGDILFGSDVAYPVAGPSSGGGLFLTQSIRTQESDGTVGDTDSGWIGTRFERGEFSCHTENSGADKPIYNSNNGGASGQFRLRLRTFNKALQVVDCGVIVGFQFGDTESGADIVKVRRLGKDGFYFDHIAVSDPRRIGTHVTQAGGSRRGGRSGWERGGNRYTGEPTSVQPPLSEIVVSTQGYKDDGGGTYTGTANGQIKNPVDYARFLIKSNLYGNGTISTSNPGSFDTARTYIDQWVFLDDWRTIANPSGKGSINDRLREIESEYGGLISFRRKRDGSWGAHVWIPESYTSGGAWASSTYYEADAIDPGPTVLAGPEGIDLDVSGDDITEVFNEVRIRYQFDPLSGQYGRTAIITRDYSDDGYRNEWDSIAGVDFKDLCAWSQDQYTDGKPRRLEIDLHWVDNPVIAVAIGWYQIARNYRPRLKLSFSGTLFWTDLQVGHVFRFSNLLETQYGHKLHARGSQPNTADGGDWDENFWRVLSVRQVQEGAASYRIVAEHMPRTIGGEISGGGGGIMDDSGAPPEEAFIT